MNPELISILLLFVFLVSAVGLLLLGLWMYRKSTQSRVHGRIQDFVEPMSESVRMGRGAQNRSEMLTTGFGRFRVWLNDTLSVLSSDKLQVKISSAYWPISDTEFIIIRFATLFLGFILGWVLVKSVFGGLFLGAFLFILPPIILERSIVNRQNKFHNQLLDVLILVRGGIQAGYGLSQALDLAVKELAPPSSEEFSRVLREVRFGFPLEQALLNLSERMESDDLQIVVTAIIINMQVGGNLSVILESVIDTIRDRMHLFGEVRSLTSYARYVGNFLSLMPFITALIIFFVTPDYFENVLVEPITQFMLFIAFLGVVIGNIWTRRIAKVKV